MSASTLSGGEYLDFPIERISIKNDGLNRLITVVSVTFPHFSHSMLKTMVMYHNFMLGKKKYYTISMFQLIRVFMCRRVLLPVTSTDVVRWTCSF